MMSDAKPKGRTHMKKFTIISFLFLFFSTILFAGEIVTITDGRQILLNTDGTYEFIDNEMENDNPDNNCIWEVRHYVDSFGDETDIPYMTTNIDGVFSNSATTNSALGVRFLIDQDGIAIKLYEYNRNHSVNTSSSEEYSITIKDDMNNTYNFSATNYSDRLRVNKNNIEDFHEILLNSKIIKFLIVESDRTSTNYRFNIDDNSGYKEIFDKNIKIIFYF